jgi:hypothetical protein
MGGGDDTSSPPLKVAPDAGLGDASGGIDATTGSDAGGDDAADNETGVADATPKTLALLRFANWSVGAPAVDFCIAPHGMGTFKTPLLGAAAAKLQDGGIDAGVAGGLSFPLASAYLPVDPAQYDVRLVAWGAPDCSAMITSDATSLPALASGGAGTIALVGAAQPRPGEPGLQIVGFLDDLKSTLSTAFLLRAINAAPDLPKVSVGAFLGGSFQTSIVGVPFGSSSAGIPNVGRSNPDSNGYVLVTPFAGTVVAASPTVPSLLDAAAGSILVQTAPLTVGVGSVVTLAIVGSTGQSLAQIVECVDNGANPGVAGNCIAR